MSIEVVLAVVIIVMGISLMQLIRHNGKEIKRLKQRLEKAGVIKEDSESSVESPQ